MYFLWRKCHERNVIITGRDALMRNWDMVVMVTGKGLFLVDVLRVLYCHWAVSQVLP